MTTAANITRLKEQLSHLSERIDFLLSRKDFNESDLGRVRVYLGMALGITSGVAPRIGEADGFLWAQDLASIQNPGELNALKIAIFIRAKSAMSAAAVQLENTHE